MSGDVSSEFKAQIHRAKQSKQRLNLKKKGMASVRKKKTPRLVSYSLVRKVQHNHFLFTKRSLDSCTQIPKRS